MLYVIVYITFYIKTRYSTRSRYIVIESCNNSPVKLDHKGNSFSESRKSSLKT